MLQFVRAACGGTCYMCRGEVLMKDLYLYRWWRLYDVDTDTPAERQGHKYKKSPHPPKHEYQGINRKAHNQSCHPQQHPLLKGDEESLSIYDIPSSASLLPSTEFIFCFAWRISVLLARWSIVSVWKEQTRSNRRGVLESALWLCIEDI